MYSISARPQLQVVVYLWWPQAIKSY